jgi:hypothetical protein
VHGFTAEVVEKTGSPRGESFADAGPAIDGARGHLAEHASAAGHGETAPLHPHSPSPHGQFIASRYTIEAAGSSRDVAKSAVDRPVQRVQNRRRVGLLFGLVDTFRPVVRGLFGLYCRHKRHPEGAAGQVMRGSCLLEDGSSAVAKWQQITATC